MKKIHKLIYKYKYPSYPEEFKPITYPGIKPGKYLISNYGNVILLKNDKIMKTYYDKDYYEKITLVTDIKHPIKRGNKSKHYFIHRLMAWEFLDPPNDKYTNVVNHINGIPCCNFIDNLEWCTVLYNTNHAKALNKLNNSGSNCVSRKYSIKLIRRICALLEDGYKPLYIVELLLSSNKIKESQVSNILQLVYKLNKKIIFHDIVSEYNYKSSIDIVSKNPTINIIRKMIYFGKTNYDILNYFGYDTLTHDRIIRSLYNKIIYQRAVCKLLFNDYRKDELIKIFGTE